MDRTIDTDPGKKSQRTSFLGTINQKLQRHEPGQMENALILAVYKNDPTLAVSWVGLYLSATKPQMLLLMAAVWRWPLFCAHPGSVGGNFAAQSCCTVLRRSLNRRSSWLGEKT